MRLRRRPWADGEALPLPSPIGPCDSLVIELGRNNQAPPRHSAPLPGLSADGTFFHEHRLPLAGDPLHSEGVPRRPRIGFEPTTEEDKAVDRALDRMIQVLARVHELEFAADQPAHVWDRLDSFWRRAEREDAILVSEIVRQAGSMLPLLERLIGRLRRVLRRERASVALDRAQEMDTQSLIWLTRQPGRTLAERAGPDQRIQAVVRRESFDTGENRVLHAWCRLAAAEARDWLRHNKRAHSSARFRNVERLALRARREARTLQELGVGIAEPGVTPNFVLTQDPEYRGVHVAWLALLREKREIDDLWAWQGRSWSDFVALAVTLSLRGIVGAELIASCPLTIHSDHDRGEWFGADVPMAVYHLRRQGLIVEVQYRPHHVEPGQDRLAAPLWLRIGGLSANELQRRVPVWPRLVFAPIRLDEEAASCRACLDGVARRLRIPAGLVVVSDPESGQVNSSSASCKTVVVGIGPSGDALREGLDAIGRFLRSEIGAEDSA